MSNGTLGHKSVIALMCIGCGNGAGLDAEPAQLEAALGSYVATGKPGEWEPMDRIVLQSQTYSPARDKPMSTVQLDTMVPLLQHGIGVELLVNSQDEGDEYTSGLVARGVSAHDLLGLKVTIQEHDDVWVRDYGPIVVKARAPGSHRDVLAVLNFKFNGWGYFDVSDPDTQALYELDDTEATAYAKANHMPVIDSTLVNEGGAVVTNGSGTIIYSLPALRQHNPTLTQTQIETELERVYGGRKAIGVPVSAPQDDFAFDAAGNLWPGLGLHGGDLYAGFGVRHIDMTAIPYSATGIFVPDFPQSDVTNAFEQACHDTDVTLQTFFAHQTTAEGQHFVVTTIPDPCLIRDEITPSTDFPFGNGDVIADILASTITGSAAEGQTQPFTISLSAGYVNFMMAKGSGRDKGVVIIPKFYKDGWPTRLRQTDAQALATFQRVFPRSQWDVVAVRTENEARDGGELHCTTQEIPAF